MDTIRWGIAGPGGIAGQFARDLALLEDAELAAVGSRSPERARAFAAEHGAARAHGSYADLVADTDLDVLYIATPHPQHHAIATAAIANGTPVLVEKAFTATLAGAEEVVAAARAAGIFAMEAMWTRFQPAVVRMRELIEEGALGEVLAVQADLGFIAPYDPEHRLFAAALGGGTLLDIGVYVVSFAQMVLGAPDRFEVAGSLLPSGVEGAASLLLAYDDGRSATLTTSFRSPLPGTARVFGTSGWLELPPRFHHPTQVVVHRPDRAPEVHDAPRLGNGLAHEALEVHACLRAGRTESAVMPLDDTLAVMRVLDEAGRRLGVPRGEDPAVLGA